MMDDKEMYREAKRRVSEKSKFFKHFYTYSIVVGVFTVLSLFRGRPFAFAPVAFFWGIGLLFHYIKVFGIPGSGVLSREWEDKEIANEMRKMRGVMEDEDNPTAKENEELKLLELRKNYDESELV